MEQVWSTSTMLMMIGLLFCTYFVPVVPCFLRVHFNGILTGQKCLHAAHAVSSEWLEDVAPRHHAEDMVSNLFFAKMSTVA